MSIGVLVLQMKSEANNIELSLLSYTHKHRLDISGNLVQILIAKNMEIEAKSEEGDSSTTKFSWQLEEVSSTLVDDLNADDGLTHTHT